jgi:hypothetical protein
MKHNKHRSATGPPSPVCVTACWPARRRRRLRLRVALLALGMGALALVAAGCGGSPAPSAAHLSATTTSTNSAVSGCSRSGCSNVGASQRLETLGVKYSGCMRAHGLPDFPDPTIGPNGLPLWTLSNVDPQSTQFQEAKRACKNDLPDLGAPPTRQDEVNAAVKYTKCMRSHGEPDFPDPNNQGVIQIPNATGTLSPNSPQYQQAATACQNLDNGFSEQGSARS